MDIPYCVDVSGVRVYGRKPKSSFPHDFLRSQHFITIFPTTSGEKTEELIKMFRFLRILTSLEVWNEFSCFPPLLKRSPGKLPDGTNSTVVSWAKECETLDTKQSDGILVVGVMKSWL